MKAVDVEVARLKKESSTKDEAIRVVEDMVTALETECKQKDDLVTEVSLRATTTEEVARLSTKRLLSSTSILDQKDGLSRADLSAIAAMEASLGLALFDGEGLEGPKFVRGIANRLPSVKTIV